MGTLTAASPQRHAAAELPAIDFFDAHFKARAHEAYRCCAGTHRCAPHRLSRRAAAVARDAPRRRAARTRAAARHDRADRRLRVPAADHRDRRPARHAGARPGDAARVVERADRQRRRARRAGDRRDGADAGSVRRLHARPVRLAFGIHYCIGAALARVEGEVAIGTLLARTRGLRLAVDESATQWRTGPLVRGLASLPLAFDPVRAGDADAVKGGSRCTSAVQRA